MQNTKLFSVIFILSTFLFSCKKRESLIQTKHFAIVLDSLKNVYAPDKRVVLWDLKLDDKKENLVGYVDNPELFDILSKELEQLSTIGNKVTLIGNPSEIVNGLINVSVANLRSNPKHSAEIATQAILGTPMKILRKKGSWFLTKTPNQYLAWVDSTAIMPLTRDQLAKYKKSKKVIFNRPFGFSYSTPNHNSETVSDLVSGCILPVKGEEKDFFKIQYPDMRTGWVRKNEVVSVETFISSPIKESNLVKTAKNFMGLPYLWGGTSTKGVDCSGFTSSVYLLNGIVIQRDASQQVNYGKKITTSFESKDLQIGDLLFFGRKVPRNTPRSVTHVGMYIGNNKFIHSAGKVQVNSLNKNDSDYKQEYNNRFIQANRIKGAYDEFGVQLISTNPFYKSIL